MDIITQLMVMAFLVEALWETLKMTWQEGKISVDRVGVLIIGLGLALVTKIDILHLVNLTAEKQYIGIIASGILASRGGNYIHDIFNVFSGFQNKRENQ